MSEPLGTALERLRVRIAREQDTVISPNEGRAIVAALAEPRVMPRDVLREALPPTICKCGLAKSYHPRLADHDYEPRYEPEAWREGYRAALVAVPSESDAGPRDVLNESVQELVRHLGLTEAYARLARP